jgi:hypothetical protein
VIKTNGMVLNPPEYARLGAVQVELISSLCLHD